ncbi:hypothetical protein KSP40_PGU005895 [Platanthera guangdongensis]|uniref:Uncharacterized protein n=1 Tax=Platanthera guangdongensis TaxID=2320717 RepID=A0ABR2MVB8_9ASPA
MAPTSQIAPPSGYLIASEDDLEKTINPLNDIIVINRNKPRFSAEAPRFFSPDTLPDREPIFLPVGKLLLSPRYSRKKPYRLGGGRRSPFLIVAGGRRSVAGGRCSPFHCVGALLFQRNCVRLCSPFLIRRCLTSSFPSLDLILFIAE